MNTPNIDHARSYLQRGWSVIPIGCDKRPLIRWRDHQRCRPADDTVRRWWRTWPGANIGVVTGAVSNLVVVDLDSPGAAADFRSRYGGDWPCTPRAVTGKGCHVYFRHPGYTVHGSASQLAPGLDVRGDGGYVVAPPSVHPSGASYTWAVRPDDAPLHELPEWIVDMLGRPCSGRMPSAPAASPPPLRAGREEERDGGSVAKSVPVGQRRQYAFRSTRRRLHRGYTARLAWGELVANFPRFEQPADDPFTLEDLCRTFEEAWTWRPVEAPPSFPPRAGEARERIYPTTPDGVPS